MGLSKEEKEKLLETVRRTAGNRERIQAERNIPEWYKACGERVRRREVTVPAESAGVPIRCVVTESLEKEKDCPVYINMHGGGFLHPQDGDDDMFCTRIAADIRGIVVDIDYATTDEHPFPTAFEQCYEVCRWVFENCAQWGADEKRVSAGGHSAGGCLAAAVSLKAAATKDFSLCLQVLDYAALDNEQALRLDNERHKAFSWLYCDGDYRVLKLPYVSPAYATDDMLKGQPRTLIINAEDCPFHRLGIRYGMRLAAMGTEVTLRTFKQSRHAFTIRLSGEWEEAQALIARTIREAGL